jgi:hypothetical protein
VGTFLPGTFFVRNLFLSGTFIIQEPFFHRSFIFLGMSFIQELFSGNLSASGAFFTGTLFSGTFRWELFGRNVTCYAQQRTQNVEIRENILAGQLEDFETHFHIKWVFLNTHSIP